MIAVVVVVIIVILVPRLPFAAARHRHQSELMLALLDLFSNFKWVRSSGYLGELLG